MTTTLAKFASLLAERMDGKYEGTVEARRKSAGFLAGDLLEAQGDCANIDKEIARLRERYAARRRKYVRMVHRYGLTTREIAGAMGLSHQRVAQILNEPDDF